MSSIARNRAAGRGAECDATDTKGSAHSAWPPYTVMKRHRKMATLLWVSLLAAFLVYVGYVLWDTVDARRHPTASIELKQNYFTFPDVMICTSFLSGCLATSVSCLEGWDLILSGQTGFLEEPSDFVPADYPDVVKIRDTFPNCAVMPLSKLTVDETGVNNGDIDYFSASFWMAWYDDPETVSRSEEYAINSQFVSAHFIDIEQDVDKIEGKITDVKLPYERLDATTGNWFTAARNHMVVSMAEFSGITKNGERKEREQTYSQTTTTGKDNWFWTSEVDLPGISFLHVEMLITKFEYTSVVEVDPVDLWAIIGAIGGVWQFVVVAFGVFFVFSEKQPPAKKRRNLKKTVAKGTKPVVTLHRRFSSTTSAASSQQDTEIDATYEDLPPGWMKRQGRTGNVYYFHLGTGATSVSPPNELDGRSASAGVTLAPQPQRAVRSPFRAAYDSQGSGSGGAQDSTSGTNAGGSLPPGWEARIDKKGRVYYADTVNKRTQRLWPELRVHSTSSSGVQPVEIPMRCRGSNTPSSQDPTPAAVLPSTTTTASGGVVDEPLPPNWEAHVTKGGKTYYTNSVTKKAQHVTPV